MLDQKNLVALMKQVAKADPSTPAAYSLMVRLLVTRLLMRPFVMS